MNEVTIKALKELLDYCEPDEYRHWQECDKPKDHIYHDIRTLRRELQAAKRNPVYSVIDYDLIYLEMVENMDIKEEEAKRLLANEDFILTLQSLIEEDLLSAQAVDNVIDDARVSLKGDNHV